MPGLLAKATVRFYPEQANVKCSSQKIFSFKGHTDSINSVEFSSDDQRIVTASADRTVKVWDAVTGQETLTLKGHTDFVEAAAFSPDNRRIASASRDQTVGVWDARPWTAELKTDQEARCLLTSLCTKLRSKEGSSQDVLEQTIQADATISEQVRRRSLEWASAFWNSSAWSRSAQSRQR